MREPRGEPDPHSCQQKNQDDINMWLAGSIKERPMKLTEHLSKS